jgi:hypothetical protein
VHRTIATNPASLPVGVDRSRVGGNGGAEAAAFLRCGVVPDLLFFLSAHSMQLVLYYSGHGGVDESGDYCAVPTDFGHQEETHKEKPGEGCTSDSTGRRRGLVNLRSHFLRSLTAPEGTAKLPGKPPTGCAIILLLDMCRTCTLLKDTLQGDPVTAPRSRAKSLVRLLTLQLLFILW